MSRVVGIDLGTTNSLVAYVKDGRPEVIRDETGDGLVPSVVNVAKDGAIVVGREAERRLLTDARRTAYSVKRFMGRAFEDVTDEASRFPFKLKKGDADGVVRIVLGDREYTPPEISAFVLRELKRRAEAFFADADREAGAPGADVDRAVITVPAYFNDAQRTATRDAGRIAGLEVLRIINEPTAASLAYGLDKRHTGVIAVYDFGGGTFDISILRVEEGVFQVLATNGDTHLGGDDIDALLMDRVLAEMSTLMSGRVNEVLQEVRRAVIRAKLELSDLHATVVKAPGIERPMSRTEFEEMLMPVVERTLAPCRQALADAGLQPNQIDEVVLVGGSTREPRVPQLVKEYFGKEPHKGVNPDEVVAVGAAIQGGVLTGDVKDLLLLDVTPLSLGIETLGGVMTTLIPRNTTIPTRKSEIFSTAVDNQPNVEVHVLQGERQIARDNRTLGRFHLVGLPPAPRGVPQIEVAFDIDANGIVNVAAKVVATGKEQMITISGSSGLNKDDVERMVKDAEAHAADDKTRRARIAARHTAD